MIYAIAVDFSQMAQKAYAEIRARSAAHRECQHYLALNRSFAQMNYACANLGDEIEQRVGSDRAHGRDTQPENEDRKQQNAAPDPCHSDEGPNSQTNQALDQQIHDYTIQCSDSAISRITRSPCGRLGRLRWRSDKALPFEVQNDLLRRFFGRQLAGVDRDFRIRRNFVRI